MPAKEITTIPCLFLDTRCGNNHTYIIYSLRITIALPWHEYMACVVLVAPPKSLSFFPSNKYSKIESQSIRLHVPQV